MDKVSDKECVSDSYPSTLLADGSIMRVEAKMVPKGGDDFGFEGEDEVDDSVETVINVVDSHQLVKIESKMTVKVLKFILIYYMCYIYMYIFMYVDVCVLFCI